MDMLINFIKQMNALLSPFLRTATGISIKIEKEMVIELHSSRRLIQENIKVVESIRVI